MTFQQLFVNSCTLWVSAEGSRLRCSHTCACITQLSAQVDPTRGVFPLMLPHTTAGAKLTAKVENDVHCEFSKCVYHITNNRHGTMYISF